MTETGDTRTGGAAAHFVLFLAVLLLYIRFVVDTRLLYYGQGMLEFPVFSWAPEYRAATLSHPGGPAEWLGALLSQFYRGPWHGAVILTVIAGVLGAGLAAVVGRLRGHAVWGVWCIPGILLVADANRYGHHPASLIGIAVALRAAFAFDALSGSREGVRSLVILGLATAVYWLAGGIVLLFCLLCLLLEARHRRSQSALVCLLAAAAVPHLFGQRLLHQTPVEAFFRLMPFSPHTHEWPGARLTLAVLLGAIVVVCIVAGLPSREPRRDGRGSARGHRRSTGIARSSARWVLPTLGLALAAGVSWSSEAREILGFNALARQGKWEAVIEAAGRMEPDTFPPLGMHTTNHALYHTGRLGDEMFHYPQSPAGMLVGSGLISQDLGYGVVAEEYSERFSLYFQLGDVAMELGLLNETEHMAHEALENLGSHPPILQDLARVGITKGEYARARVFLEALRFHIGYDGWAEEKAAHALPDADPDELTRYLRSVMQATDHTDWGSSVENRLLGLLESNPGNHMAVHYLLAFYLLVDRLDDFVDSIHRLQDVGEERLPVHFQEAVLVWERESGKEADLWAYEISPECRESHRRFREDLANLGTFVGIGRASEELATGHGSTFYYYHAFGRSGVGGR